MTLYQSELLRKLSQYNCSGQYNEQDGHLQIYHGGMRICYQSGDGYFCYDNPEALTDEYMKLRDDLSAEARTIREYVRLYETSPNMKIQDVSEYRKFAEYGDTVLAGMYSERHGFMFATWKQDNKHNYVTAGDYSPNYPYVKESFITRSDLMSKHRIFTEDEITMLYKCIDFAKGNCESLTYDQEKALDALAEKMNWGYPHLAENPPSFDEDEGMQINM